MAREDKSPFDELDENEALRTILEGTSTETGKEFFNALVKNLAKALNTHAALVTEFLENSCRLRAIAFWVGGNWYNNYEYDISGTPCETVIKKANFFHYPVNVQELYPDDEDLKKISAESYMGVPLKDVNDNVLGHIAVMDTKPMPEEPRGLALFHIFAARATAELQRLQAEAEIKEREEKLSRLIDGVMDAIFELDQNLRVTLINAAAKKIFEYESDQIIGKNFSRLLTKESVEKLLRMTDELENKTEGEKYLWIPGGLEAVRNDGDAFPAEATLSQSNKLQNKYYTLILRNVNERIEAENKIQTLSIQTEYLKEEIKELHNFENILGNSTSLLQVLNDIKKVAPTDSTVLICGETGTGKELIARAIHAESNRSDMPLIKVNCAAIPSNLIESEFFGHEKGAFTGAISKREGRFSLANGGTIFLDEIGELPLDLQSKLLRVLQEGEFEAVGSSKTNKVDVRVLAATNRNLLDEVKSRNFREDLYYRLNVFPLEIPPLKERGDDIIHIAQSFSERFANRMGLEIEPLSEDDINSLKTYDWPGNIRELQNLIERAVITSQNGKLNLAKLLPENGTKSAEGNKDKNGHTTKRVYTIKELQELEKENIVLALKKTKWKISGDKGAAKLLGIPPTTLSSRIKSLGIKRQA